MGAELSQQREERPRKPRNKPITTEVIKISPRDPDVEGIEAYGSVEITDRALQHALGNESQQNDSQIRFIWRLENYKANKLSINESFQP
jgi:hypothetical protein